MATADRSFCRVLGTNEDDVRWALGTNGVFQLNCCGWSDSESDVDYGGHNIAWIVCLSCSGTFHRSFHGTSIMRGKKLGASSFSSRRPQGKFSRSFAYGVFS